MKRAGSWGGERRQAKRHLARFLLPTVLYAQTGMSVKGADERIWGLQSSVRRPYITHLPVRCSVLSVLGRSLLLVSKSLLEWQRGLKYNTFWKERYIFNENMRSLSLRVSWERSFDFRDWTSLDFSVAVNTLIAVKIIIIIIIYIYIAQTSIWIYSVALYNIVILNLCKRQNLY